MGLWNLFVFLRYRVVHDPAGWVNVDENTGLVTAVKELDRESPYVNNSVYSVIVHAVDDGKFLHKPQRKMPPFLSKCFKL